MSLHDRLHTTFAPGTPVDRLKLPRRYTLTHSDVTSELFLTIGTDYDRKQVSGWYTRFMRDEVLAEWVEIADQEGRDKFLLRVYCHVSGGIVFGTAGMRYNIFRQHLPMVLEAFREAERDLYLRCPELEETPISVRFAAWQRRYQLEEDWGKIGHYG
jgi:hypothetical protein